MNLLLESEVAQMLRCSTSKVKRLRLSGKLPFIPGRPVLIKQDDVDEYITAALKKVAPTVPERPSKAKMHADARQWALGELLLKRDRRSPSAR